jgi:hypothetical protein
VVDRWQMKSSQKQILAELQKLKSISEDEEDDSELSYHSETSNNSIATTRSTSPVSSEEEPIEIYENSRIGLVDYESIKGLKNTTTFLDQTPLTDLNKENFLALDNYGFDVLELVEYGIHSLANFYKNPHSGAAEFSKEAKAMLHKHPKLSEYAKALDKQLAEQKQCATPELITIVIDMLKDISRVGIDGADDPRIKLLAHLDTYSEDQRKKIEDYIIQVATSHLNSTRPSSVASGEALFAFSKSSFDKGNNAKTYRALTFAEALVGGNPATPCVRTLQVFLWKFVLEHKPEMLNQIPESVKRIARQDHYLLGEAAASSSPRMSKNKLNSLGSITEDEPESPSNIPSKK